MGFGISQDQMQTIQQMIGRVVERGQPFKIYPPKEVVDDPSVLKAPDIVERLANTKWWVRFAADDEHVLTFVELMVLTYQLAMIKMRFAEHAKNPTGKLNVKMNFSIDQIMTLEGVRTLLAKLTIEGVETPAFEQPRVSIKFPIYAVHEGKPGESAQIQGITDPVSGDNAVILFTDLELLKQFAQTKGSGEPFLLAHNLDQLKAFLKHGEPQLVLFDPTLANGQLLPRHLIRVIDILST